MSEWRQEVVGTWADRLVGQSSRATSIAEGLTPEQLVARPAPEKWSVAHCLDHLAVTLDAYHPHLESAIARRSTPAEFPEYRAGRLARWFIRMAGPGSRPLEAPRMFRPSDEEASPDAVSRFAEATGRWLDLLRAADGVDLVHGKIRSPITALLRFRVGEVIELMVEHNDRHLGQAERAREAVLGP